MRNIFIIIVTFNGEYFIKKYLKSLLQSKGRLKIVIVDNASTDNTVQIIKNQYPKIDLFMLKDNIGFGRANNLGIKYAYEQGAEHILLLNQDAIIDLPSIHYIVSLQKKYPEYGILSPIHLDKTKNQIDYLFSYHLRKSTDLNSLFSDFFLKKSIKKVYTIKFMNAAIWMLSRKCVEKVGLFLA